jgi:predicted ATPase with chaperone activity
VERFADFVQQNSRRQDIAMMTSAQPAFDQETSPSPLNAAAQPSISFDGDDACWAVAATHAQRNRGPRRGQEADGVQRQSLPSDWPDAPLTQAVEEFIPRAPKSLSQIGITEAQIEALILKFLLNRGTASGREIKDQIKLPLPLFENVLREMKGNRLVEYKSTLPAADYLYRITDDGMERARRYSKQSTYCGAAPVSLPEYVESVKAQSVRRQSPGQAEFRRAFHDLVLKDEVVSQIGQAVTSGLAMFLHGAPGNGKTSIAERVTRAYSESIWIPRAISVWGEIIRLYDPSNHVALPMPESRGALLNEEHAVDLRWIRIRRPTIVAGGELTMDDLEINTNPSTGISEAPLQMKSNCGTLVIDDFGRQRISPVELLNRWIVPLEKRHDYLNLSSGRKIQVPFEQLIIFSTNLAPEKLVDEAFLRRIPYKVDVENPSETEFRRLFLLLASQAGLACEDAAVDYLLDKHYRPQKRAMRYCHPRDLLNQALTYCRYHNLPPTASAAALDAAAKNYFTMM